MILFSAIVLLFILLAIGTPVGFAMAITGSYGLWQLLGFDALLGVLRTVPFSSVGSYELITVPMFLLMAEFVIISGVVDELFAAASTWVGRVKGGLAMGTAVAGAGFGAISGSSTASAATLASTTIPAMLKQGYEPELACGVVAISGTLAMLIPPSIGLVLFGIIANADIGQLLIAGVIPGILVTVAICLTVRVLILMNPNAAPSGRAYSMREKLLVLKVVGPVIFLFFAVTGVIYTGIATPTEASALGALGAFLLAIPAIRKQPPLFWQATARACVTTCMIMLIILGASIFGYFVALTDATQNLVLLLQDADLSRWLVLFFILLGLVVLGCFMDQIAILFLTVPILIPLIVAYDFDVIWFGIVMIVTAELGMVTPPVGMNAFVISRYTNRSLVEIFRGVLPHIYAHFIVIALLVMFPAIVLWLPNSMK